MTRRQTVIASLLPPCRVLADVGCDHGYLAKYALDHGLCERAIVSDISAKSLQKAETLLKDEIANGRCTPIVCDGLEGYETLPDCVLIAGMGGEEIVKILSPYPLPSRFVLQPMKNAEKVRAFLLERGARITADFTFRDGKFYEIVAGEGGGADGYSERELKYGRDNLRRPSADFVEKLQAEREKIREILLNTPAGEGRRELEARLEETEEIYREITKNL